MKTIKNIINSIKEKSEIKDFINKWKLIMVNTGLYNSNYDTFTMYNIKKTNKGFNFRVYCPVGLTFDDLNKIKETIENCLRCKFEYKINQFNEYANAEMQFEN